MKKLNFLSRTLLLITAVTLMSISNLYANEDFKAFDFKTGHNGMWADNLTFTDHSITIEFWMNMSQTTATTEGSNVFESFHDPNGIIINIRNNADSLELRFFVKDRQATPQAVFFYVPSATYTEKWTHFAFVVSESDEKSYLYINGELFGEKNVVGGYYGNYREDGVSTRSFNIGGAFWGSAKFYGKLADVRVWSVARTAEEVKANFNKHLDAVPVGLYINYKFNSFERGQVNFAGENNKGWCNPEASWHTYYGTETLSAYPRNLAITDGSLSWDTSAGEWEVSVFKSSDDANVFTDTITTNSVSVNEIAELVNNTNYYAKVRTLNNGVWSGQVTSEVFTVSKVSTGFDKIENQTKLRVNNGVLIINAEHPQTLNIYAVNGQLIRSVNVVAGENTVSNLSKGLYLVNNQKIVIR
mgnify:CR=1 FL=1